MENQKVTNRSEEKGAALTEKLEAALDGIGCGDEVWSETAAVMGQAMAGCTALARVVYAEELGELATRSDAPEIVRLATAIFDKLIVGVRPVPDPGLMVPGIPGVMPNQVIRIDPSGGA